MICVTVNYGDSHFDYFGNPTTCQTMYPSLDPEIVIPVANIKNFMTNHTYEK